MENVIHALHRLADNFAVADIALDELYIKTVKVFEITGSQTVKNADFRFALKILNQMTADESGSAGNENTHKIFPL